MFMFKFCRDHQKPKCKRNQLVALRRPPSPSSKNRSPVFFLFIYSFLLCSWALLGALGALLSALGALLGALETLLGALGPLLGALGPLLEPLGTSRSRLGPLLGPLWASWGGSWRLLGLSWGLLGARKGATPASTKKRWRFLSWARFSIVFMIDFGSHFPQFLDVIVKQCWIVFSIIIWRRFLIDVSSMFGQFDIFLLPI